MTFSRRMTAPAVVALFVGSALLASAAWGQTAAASIGSVIVGSSVDASSASLVVGVKKGFFKKYGVDVRSLRYPGLIGWKSAPGGGTTDYAVHVFHEALKSGSYECFLSENTTLPMMYMPDAIKATIGIMESDYQKVKIRSSYNLSGFSFSPKEIALEIKKYIPNFSISYIPDSRQQIADSWPKSIDSSEAGIDWGWKPEYDLAAMTKDMIKNLKISYGIHQKGHIYFLL